MMGQGTGSEAARIHRDALVVDAHSDVFCDVARRRAHGGERHIAPLHVPAWRDGEERVLGRLHVPAWREGGVDVVVTTLYVEEEHKPDRALRRAMTLLGAALDDMAKTPEVAGFCRTRAEIDAAVADGKIAFVLAMEGGEPLQEAPEALAVFHALGLRVLGLTWNQRNLLAEGVGEERADGGLTELGRRIVADANRLGIVLDASHLAPRSFWDLIGASTGPVIASHSNAKALCGHRRNLDDDQLRAIVETGGVIGVVGVPGFISDDPKDATLDGMLDHLDYVANLVGVEHVALGPDFVDYLRDAPGVFRSAEPPAITTGFATIRDLPAVTAGLVARGYDERAIRGVLGENLLRVLFGA